MREIARRAKGGGPKRFVRERALSYSVLRRAWLESLVLQFRQQRTIPFATPIEHGALFIEADRHRDKDGVYGGGMKLIWDALVEARLLPADTAAHVGKCRGWDVTYGHPADAGVWLVFYEPDGDETRMNIRGRLPDLNELLSARELGARRSVSG